MSAFQPVSFEEAKTTHRPMKRKSPLRAVRSARQDSRAGLPTGKLRRASAKARGKASSKRKRPSTKRLKQKAWEQFSIFIRTRGADAEGSNTCCTCKVRKHWTDLQAGHFIAGRNNAVLFCERGTNPQCYSCNVGKHGNGVMYYKFMLEKVGQQVIDELIFESNQTRKWRPGELQALYEKYKALNDANPVAKEHPTNAN